MHRRTRIKICGITRREDALFAAEAGADAIGLVFVDASPRAVDVQTAAALRRALPPFVQVVALFMDASTETVSSVVQTVAPDLLQFHGREDARFCGAFGRPYLKTVAAGAGTADLGAASAAYPDAMALLVDGHAPGEMGGSGKHVSAQSLVGASHHPLVLAGGLKPDNVAAAVEQFRPWAVDVSSGVETAPGIKDRGLIAQFITEVAKADEQQPE